MKTKKLNLNDLKVDSFITSLEGEDAQTVKGGSTAICAEAGASGIAFGVALVTAVYVGAMLSLVVKFNEAVEADKEASKCNTNK